MNNDTQTQEAQEENFVYEIEDETPAVDKKLETSPEKTAWIIFIKYLN